MNSLSEGKPTPKRQLLRVVNGFGMICGLIVDGFRPANAFAKHGLYVGRFRFARHEDQNE